MISLSQLREAVAEPGATDQDEARQELMSKVILVMVGITVALFTIPIVVGWILGTFDLVPVLIMLFLAAAVGVSHWLLQVGRWQQAIRFPIILFFLLGLFGNYTNGLSTNLNLFYVLVILLVAIFCEWKTQLIAVGLSIISPLVITLIRAPTTIEALIEDLLAGGIPLSGLLIGTALLQWFSTGQLQRALAQARDYAAELKEYRHHLEELVEARSADLLQANEQLRAEVTERKRIEAALAQKAQDLTRSHAFIATLNQVATRLESTHSPDQILETLSDELKILGLTCVVALQEPESEELIVRYTSIEPAKLALAEELAGRTLHGHPIPRDALHFHETIDLKRALYVPEPTMMMRSLFPEIPEATLEQAIELAGAAPDTPAIYLPLTVEERTVGAFAVWGPDLREDDVSPLLVFARQVASSLENARLFQAEQRRTMELSTLLQAAGAVSATLNLEETLTLIAEQMVKAADVDGCTISRWDQEAGAVVTWIEWRRDLKWTDEPGTAYALEDFPATRAVLETRQPVSIRASDPDADPAEVGHMRKMAITNLLMLPLAVGERVIGLLELDEHQRERHFTAAEIRLCRALADQAAVAIENSRLYLSARQELKERQRAEEALQQAYDELEQRVEERTAELREVNVILRDEIAERKRAEEALRRSERLLHSLIESLPQNVYSKDLEGRFTFANQRYCTTAGKGREEILGKTDYELHPLELAGKYLRDDRRVIETEQVFETVEEHKPLDGESIYVQVIKTPLYDSEGQVTGTLGIFWDITERKRAEQLLRALNQAALAMEKALAPNEIFAAVADEFKKLDFHCMIFLTDESRGRLFPSYVSYEAQTVGAVENLTGLRHEDFAFPVENVELYKKVIWEKETVLIKEEGGVMQQVLPGSAKRLAGQLVEMFKMSKSIAAPLIVEDQVIGVLSVLSSDLVESDMPAITAFAHQVAAAWRKAQLVQDLASSLEELKRTQAQLLQAQKMEAIGRLAGGVAHDFNNLLTVIQGNTQLLMRQLHLQDPLRERTQQIQEAGERATRLTKQLLRFSRREIVEPRVVHLNRIITDLNRMLQRIIGEDIELVTTLAADLWPMKVDPAQIEQVIINLAVNARDAMPHGGRLSIETANVILDEAFAAYHVDVQPGQYVLLTVGDTGVGMDDGVRDHLFEPFFTTKEPGQGTGLGLSTVYGIVKQNAGHVWVYSEPGQGTTFKIYLPRTAQPEAPRKATLPAPSASVLQGSETILMVEDEAAVREVAVQILKAHGYRVLTAQNGPEALEIAREYMAPIHLLLTDVVMPEMNGKELAEQLLAQHPAIRILYMSGYSGDVIAHRGVLEEGAGFLGKPFTLEELALKVRAILDAH